ncbi:MAG: DUF928 domain-containing protein [Cyanobacteria bacterium J06635_15]
MLGVTISFWVIGFGDVGLSMPTASEVPIQGVKQATTQAPDVVFNFPQNFEPPGDGRPEDTRGSGSRTGACSAAALDSAEHETSDADRGSSVAGRIRAIAPIDRFGLTLQSHPKVFINLDGDVAPSVVMRVQDEAGDYDERVTLPVDPNLPIQGFALPGDRPPLEVGKNYLWTILVACDGQVNPYHPIFSGWVQRVALSAAPGGLQQQPIAEQIDWYTHGGYWYDLVETLYQAQQATPTNNIARETWEQLLEFVDR